MNSSAAKQFVEILGRAPGELLAVLETDAVGRILPTIQSRCPEFCIFKNFSKEALDPSISGKKESDSIGKAKTFLLS